MCITAAMESPHIILSDIKMTELAEALGLKLSTVSRVVNGNRLSIPVGRAIADHLGQPLADLFPAIHEKTIRIERRNQERNKPKVVRQRPVYNTDDLRKACKHLMVDLDLERNAASYSLILPRLSDKMGKPVAVGTLAHALSGDRQGPAYRNLLTHLHELLKNWPQIEAA